MKKILLSLAIVIMVLSMVACGKKQTSDEQQEASNLFQLQSVKEGETTATIKTNKGDIKVRLFKDAAPLAVENFVTHAKNGYYDGLTFHRVIQNFVVQGGDPNGDGTGGESIWGDPFKDEINSDLRHFRGALSMANAGTDTNGSQFFIVQNNNVEDSLREELQTFLDNQDTIIDEENNIKLSDIYSEEVCNEYLKNGGTPTLDGYHTVFGQVFEGMDVVDSIAAVETDENDMPVEQVIIESIEIFES